MVFPSQFASYFTPEEKDSELYRIISMIGTNVEKALMESLDSEVRNSVELLAFPDARLRSWLAYLLVPVPNKISSSGDVSFVLTHAGTPVQILKGALIGSKLGPVMEVQDSITVTPGSSVILSLRQGRTETISGTYHGFITLKVPNVDLSDLQVSIEGSSVPLCPLVSDRITPMNGYFAFYFNDTLFVQILPGSNVINPEGYTFEVTYRISDGWNGNLPPDNLLEFEDKLVDLNGDDVAYNFIQDEISGGRDAPRKYELVNMLRARMFNYSSVSSVPEYRLWFLRQPEVGDVLVQGDYERWLASDDPVNTDIPVSGIVTIYAIGIDSNDLSPGVQQNLANRLSLVRDLAVIRMEPIQKVWNYFLVSYVSSSNNALFESDIRQVIQNFYNLVWCRENDVSTFLPLDMTKVTSLLSSTYTVQGLRIIPYHYTEVQSTGFSSTLIGAVYLGEVIGSSWYELVYNSDLIPEMIPNPNYNPNLTIPNPNYSPNVNIPNPNYDPRPLLPNPAYDPNPTIPNPNYDPRVEIPNPNYDPNEAESPTNSPMIPNPNYDPVPSFTNPAYDPIQFITNPAYDPNQTIPNPNYDPNPTIPNPNYDPNPEIVNPNFDPDIEGEVILESYREVVNNEGTRAEIYNVKDLVHPVGFRDDLGWQITGSFSIGQTLRAFHGVESEAYVPIGKSASIRLLQGIGTGNSLAVRRELRSL